MKTIIKIFVFFNFFIFFFVSFLENMNNIYVYNITRDIIRQISVFMTIYESRIFNILYYRRIILILQLSFSAIIVFVLFFMTFFMKNS